MFAISQHLNGHAAKSEWQPAKVLRFTALLGAVCVASVVVIAVSSTADINVRRKTAGIEYCLDVEAPADRLSCYDKLAQRPAPQPARGANAPPLFGPR